MGKQFELVEPNLVEPIYCSGIASAVVINGMAYLTFYVDQPHETGIDSVINVRLIVTQETLMDVAGRAMSATTLERSPLAQPTYVGGRYDG